MVKGNLKDFHPIEVLQLLRENKETGILLVESRNLYIGMYFVDGMVAYAFKSDKVSDLFTKKFIDEFVTAVKVRDKERFANLLSKVKASISEFMKSKEGTFSFEKANFFIDDGIKEYLMSTERLIVAESRHVDDEAVLERKISSPEMVFQKVKNVKEILSKVQLEADEYRVLDAINGRRTVAEIVEFTGLPELRVKQILYGFLCAGLIKRAPRRIWLADILSLGLIKKLINRIRGL